VREVEQLLLEARARMEAESEKSSAKIVALETATREARAELDAAKETLAKTEPERARLQNELARAVERAAATESMADELTAREEEIVRLQLKVGEQDAGATRLNNIVDERAAQYSGLCS